MKLSKRKYSSKTRKNKTLNLHGGSFNTNFRGGQKMSRKKNRLQGQKRINKYNYRKIKGGVDKIIDEPKLNDADIKKINEYLSSKLNDADIAKINEYLSSEKYKNDDGFLTNMSSQLASLAQNSQFIDFLKINNIFEKFKAIENPKKNVKIVFYSSKGRPNSLRKYPYFRVFIEDGNTINDMMDQVDTSLSNIMDSGIQKRNQMYTRSVNIEIEDLSKMLEQKMAKEKDKNSKPKK